MTGKRILICCNRTLELGGIEKALTTFLRAFNTKDNKITLVLHDSKGVFHSELPLEDIEVLYTDTIDAYKYLKDDMLHFRVGGVIKGLWNRVMLRLDSNWYAQIMYTYRIIKRGLVFPGHFDCAISFTTDYSDLAVVLSANAEKRICFVHGDATQGKRAARLNDNLVRKYNKIYCVSERAKTLFLSVHPRCEKMMDVMYNVILPEDILSKANESIDDMILDGTPTICTVGRVSPEKGQQMIPETAELLKNAGFHFRWYIIGDGCMRPEIEQAIKEKKLQSQVIMLGAKPNPYPYMKNCDIYVQTSFSEAYCLTIAEARILSKPIVATDAPGASEQIANGENGLIIDKKNPNALFEGIRLVLTDKKLQDTFADVLKQSVHKSKSSLSKLYTYISN